MWCKNSFCQNSKGEDKPLKYPTTFKWADMIIVSKIDIAEAVGFDQALAWKNLQQIAPDTPIFPVSAKTGQGLNEFYSYLFLFRPAAFPGNFCCSSSCPCPTPLNSATGS